MTMRRCQFHVAGRVQGVGYRWFARRAAAEHAVSGWVRNRGDGAVEGEAQGAPAAVATFLLALESGPPTGHVTAVTCRELPPRDGETGFQIRF